jgi:hypothetical protein
VAAGLLTRLGADAEPAVRAALADQTVRRYAMAWLEDRNLPTPPLTESDQLWLFVDTTAGILDDDDPRAAVRAMADAEPDTDQVLDRVRLIWQSQHPATGQVLTALGRYHPRPAGRRTGSRDGAAPVGAEPPRISSPAHRTRRRL